jgi:hypothetical protein
MCGRDSVAIALENTFGVASVEPSSATMISASRPRALKYSAHAARLAGSRRASLYAGRIRLSRS